MNEQVLPTVTGQISVGALVFSFEQTKEEIAEFNSKLMKELQQVINRSVDLLLQSIRFWLKTSSDVNPS